MQFNFDNTYKNLAPELFSECQPATVSDPQMVIWNEELAEQLGLSTENIQQAELEAIFSGNKIPIGAVGIAQAYGGHQFGYFNRLGDGRAILLGEQITPEGKRYDLQFKGSGATPYSRRGDGKATLSAMLREYIISEAMQALGIPTTRSLAVVASGEAVYREQVQSGAILTRVAASHIRVGTFEYIARFCPVNVLKQFTEYTIGRHYAEIQTADNKYLEFLRKVMQKQIDLIVNWMRVGFIHGVMNTDNMSISGETIDYGPCAFMNAYKPETVFSSIDTGGRYAFGNQPTIALWNLSRFAESLLPLIDTDLTSAIKMAEAVLNTFQTEFEEKYFNMLGRKIGIQHLQKDDKLLINKLLNWMYLNNADYTNTFVRLMYPKIITDKIYEQESFIEWETEWKNRLSGIKQEIFSPLKLMQQTNPVYIPRNHKVEEVLKNVTESGELTAFEAFIHRLSTPYSTTKFDKNYMQPPAQTDEQNYKTYCGT